MSGLHCAQCGTALSDRNLMLGRDFCDYCLAEDERILDDAEAEGWWDEDEELAT